MTRATPATATATKPMIALARVPSVFRMTHLRVQANLCSSVSGLPLSRVRRRPVLAVALSCDPTQPLQVQDEVDSFGLVAEHDSDGSVPCAFPTGTGSYIGAVGRVGAKWIGQRWRHGLHHQGDQGPTYLQYTIPGHGTQAEQP